MLDLWNGIAEHDVQAADRVRDSIYNAIVKLVAMPGMGHKRDDLTDKPLRFWPVGQFLIIYLPDTDPLRTVRVVSGYRDVLGLLLEP